MKLLHIDSSVLGPHSISRQASAAIVARRCKATPQPEVVYCDLSATPLPHCPALQGAATPDATLKL